MYKVTAHFDIKDAKKGLRSIYFKTRRGCQEGLVALVNAIIIPEAKKYMETVGRTGTFNNIYTGRAYNNLRSKQPVTEGSIVSVTYGFLNNPYASKFEFGTPPREVSEQEKQEIFKWAMAKLALKIDDSNPKGLANKVVKSIKKHGNFAHKPLQDATAANLLGVGGNVARNKELVLNYVRFHLGIMS